MNQIECAMNQDQKYVYDIKFLRLTMVCVGFGSCFDVTQSRVWYTNESIESISMRTSGLAIAFLTIYVHVIMN